MIFSPSEVLPIAASSGFRAEMIEKVLHLLNLLDRANRHPMLKGRWVLKEGTALNLFVFDLPRLSVDIDLNYVGRDIALPDVHELAAGKLAALPARGQARGLSTVTRSSPLRESTENDSRLAFVAYGGMNRKDWRTVSIADVDFDPGELARLLIPTLNRRFLEKQGPPAEYGDRLVKECRAKLEAILPFNDPECEFLNLLLEKGAIDASILTTDKALQERIQNQPLPVGAYTLQQPARRPRPGGRWRSDIQRRRHDTRQGARVFAFAYYLDPFFSPSCSCKSPTGQH